MGDNEFNMDSALEKLFSEERKKQPYYLVSTEQSRSAILEAFYDHLTELQSAQNSDMLTVDDFLLLSTSAESNTAYDKVDMDEDEDEEVEGSLSKLAIDLDHLIQRDIETHDIVIGGEVQVAGDGIYMYYNDINDGFELEILEDGDTIIGDAQAYEVAPLIPYNLFLKAQANDTDIWDEYDGEDNGDTDYEMPGLWLKVVDASVRNKAGTVLSHQEEVIVPLMYPSLTFSKVVRQSKEELQSSRERPPESVSVSVAEHFKSDFVIEMCNDIENDLNHNEYDDNEEAGLLAQSQEQLKILMSPVDKEKEIVLSANTIKTLEGKVENDITVGCRYLEPILMKPDNSWRVVHTFAYTSDKGEVGTAHVLPEDITSLTYKDA